MNIVVYTFCYNEIPILPFVVQYWKLFATKVVVYDNESTDGSQAFLKSIPFIELRSYNTNGQLDDFKLQELKNSVWKESRGYADFVVVCDLDECIWSRNMNLTLQRLHQARVAAISPYMCNLISHDFPKCQSNLVHQVVDHYYDDYWPSNDGPGRGLKRKMLVFDPSRVVETNYKVGCYESTPAIEDGYSLAETNDILCMHLHDVGLARKIQRYSERRKRMSKVNIEEHLSDFYLESPSQTIADFTEDLKRSKSVASLLSRSDD